MILVDVNLLLYAVLTGFDQHEKARRWWEGALSERGEVGLCGPAVFGFLRISTSRRVFANPLAVGVAIDYVQAWLERPQVRFVVPGPRHLAIAFELMRTLGVAGNLTTDVQLAALAIEYQAELQSSDTDFGRFPDLVWKNPLR